MAFLCQSRELLIAQHVTETTLKKFYLAFAISRFVPDREIANNSILSLIAVAKFVHES